MPPKNDNLTGQLYRLRETGRLPRATEAEVNRLSSIPSPSRAMAFDGFRWFVWLFLAAVVGAQIAGLIWWATA